MKYALGNMLNGAGGLNADQLALDLPFAVTKSLTAAKGPTPTFTRASSGTFVGSNGLIQSAGNNVARFDHDPVTLASKGLLIEESRTNLILQSETLGTTWTQTNVSISSNVAVAPDGNTTADKIVENTASAIHGVDQQTTFTAIPYTLSFYAKKDGRTWVRAFISGLASTWFNIDNGTLGTVAAGFTASITNAGNGWYRCSITGTASAGTLSSGVRMATADAVNTYLGDGTSGMFIWGAQLEAGSFATSYIPTTTASVVRSVDVCSISGAGFTGMWNALEGSLFTSAIFNAPVAYGTSQAIIDINDTTNLNRLRLTKSNVTGFMSLNNTSNSTQNVSISSTSAFQPFISQKFSTGFKLDDFVFYANNSQIGSDNSGTMIVSPTTFTIGDASAGFSPRLYLNGIISSIRYYRKRLPNTKLQAITV